MDSQKKQLLSLVLYMVREVYIKTMKLEETFQSSSINLLDKRFDPVQEVMNALNIPQDNVSVFAELIGLYIEGEMTLPELVLAFEEKEQQIG
ncbi:hypothetical protein [Risungbinella massiliensis]|uniref:hypothetical protein n=1 Tax=Risungbinella massiliensis TaxID=1329796 RepID=UPI0005CC4F21|nr:hypothetical protein [Risungbinella massiliensis]